MSFYHRQHEFELISMSFSISICLTQDRRDCQYPLTDADSDADAHKPHPEVDMLGPDEHSGEDETAFKAFDERRPHCHASEFVVLPIGSNGGAVEEDEIVDVEASFEKG